MRLQALMKWLVPLLGIGVSTALMWLVLRGIPLGHIWNRALHANVWLLGAAAGLAIAGNLVRVARWRVLLGRGHEASYRTLFASMMVGYLVNNITPARLGELVRIYLLERTTDVSLGRTAASVVVERVIEAVVLLAAAISIAAVIRVPESLRTALEVAGGAIFAICVLLFAFEETGRFLLRKSARWARRRVSYSRRHATAFAVERFMEGIAVLRSPRRAAAAVALSGVIWIVEGGSVAMVAWAIGAHLPPLGALFLLTAIGISFAVPAAPGGVGPYEYAAILALAPFRIPNGSAVELALMLHAMAYAVSGVLGLIGTGMELESLRELIPGTPKRHHSREKEPRP